MQNPLLDAWSVDKYRDSQAYDVNLDFDNRIMRQALPIRRMLTDKGAIDREAITAEDNKGFTDASTLWNELSGQMPKGRGVDPVVFQQKYAMGKQMYDMNLANQLAQMDQAGFSQKQIWGEFGANPELRRYMVDNNLMQPQVEKGVSGLGTVGQMLSVGAGVQGVSALNRLRKTPVPTKEQLKNLKSEGFKWSKDRIKPMTAADYVRGDKADFPKKLDEPKKEDFKYKKGKSKGKPNTPAYKKALADWKIKEADRKKIISDSKQAAKDAVKATKGLKQGQIGSYALKQGSKGIAGKMATNMALRNVAGTLGSKVGTGALALGARGLGFLGMTNPIGIALNLGLAGSALYKYLKQQNKIKSNEDRWK